MAEPSAGALAEGGASVASAQRARLAARRRSARHRAAALSALGLALAIPPLLFNGAFGWATVVTAALALVALAAALWTSEKASAAGSSLGLVVCGAFVLTCAQATPLPSSFVHAFRPDVYEDAVLAAAARGEAVPGFLPLSLDPGSTRERALASLAVAACFLAASLLGRRARTQVLRLAAGSVALVALVTLAHVLAGARAVYGVYEATYASGLIVSPLINANHLGGLSLFGALLALGLAASAERPASRVGWGLVVFVTSALVFASLSRAAIVAFAVGAVGYAFAYERRARRRASREGDRRLIVFACVVAALAAVAFVGIGRVVGELTQGDLHKLEMHRRATGLLFVHPLLGVGRGAFSSAFAPVMGTMQRYVHPENLLLQWATEWGLPFAALLFFTALRTLSGIARRTRSPARLAGVVGILALGLQNLFDFGLEMSGEVVVVAAVMGAIVREREEVRSRFERFTDRRLGAALLVAGAFALPSLGPSVAEGGVLERTSRIEATLASGDAAGARALAERASRRHPREPNFALLAAAASAREGDPEALRWLNRAMTLAPLWSSPHELAAAWLLAHGHLDQGLLEVREAEARRAGSGVALACRLFRELPRPDLVERASPAEAGRRVAFSDALAACLPRGSVVARAIDARLIREAPHLATPLVRQARRDLDAGDAGRALALLEPRARDHLRDMAFVLVRARALSAAGRGLEAASILERARPEGRDRRRILEALVETYAGLGRADEARGAVIRLRGLAGGHAAALARVSVTEGEAEERMDHPARAIRAYREADRYDQGIGGLERAARVIERSGNRTQQVQIYSTLCLRNGQGSPACEALRRLREPSHRGARSRGPEPSRRGGRP